MKKNVCIAGAGLVTSKGYLPEDLWKALTDNKKHNNYGNDNLAQPCNLEERFKGISSCASLGINSAMLAWKGITGYNKNEIKKDMWGVYCGTYFGGVTQTQEKQCNALIQYGPLGIMPGQSIHSGYHLTADIVAIDYQLEGPNTTFTSGKLASGMAALQAFDDISEGIVDGAVVIGTEAVDNYILDGYRILGNDTSSLSSGAGSLILYSGERCDAFEKDSAIGYIKSIAIVNYPAKPGKLSFHLSKNLKQAVVLALEEASLTPADIDLVISTGNSSYIENEIVKKAFQGIFRNNFVDKYLINMAEKLGDTLGANSIVGLGTALLCIIDQKLPKSEGALDRSVQNVVITSIDPSGSAWVSIVSKE